MAYSRSGVLANNTITLNVIFQDTTGTLVSPAALPEVYIYDETFETEDIEAEVLAGIFTGLGPYVPTLVAPGYYEYEFEVPDGSNGGEWHDLWLTEINGADADQIFSFTVLGTADFSLQTILANTLLVILLDGDIASTTGEILDEEVQLTFSTRYSPLYASVDIVRAEVGTWVDCVEDDTLSLLIHWASLEVDAISPRSFYDSSLSSSIDYSGTSRGRNSKMFNFARTKFVIYDTALRTLTLPANMGGKTKRLADLMIKYDNNFQFVIDELKDKREEWYRVVNAGGNIVPGQGLDPTFASKGLRDPDRRRVGRLWHDPDEVFYSQPSQNTKSRRFGQRRFKFRFRD